MHATFVTVVSVLFLLTCPLTAGWQELRPLPEPNGGFLCGIEGDRILVLGGTHWEGGQKNWLTTLHAYDPTSGQWTTTRDAIDRPVAYGVDMQHGTRVAFVGGSDGKTALQVVGTIEGGRVRLHALPELPMTLVLSAGGRVGEQMIIVGGTDDAANIAGVTAMTHGVKEGQVRRLADYPGRPFAVAASVVAEDELFVFGGMNCDHENGMPTNSASAHAFAPGTNQWRALKSLPQAVRGLAAVMLDATHLYLGGGFAEQFTAEAVVYDIKTDSYRSAPPLPYAGMVRLVRLGDFIYCLGGEDKMKSRTAKFYRIPVSELLK